MKLWGKFFLAILTLSLLSYGISDAAFAAVEPLSVTTNKEFYTEGATICIETGKPLIGSDASKSFANPEIVIVAPST